MTEAERSQYPTAARFLDETPSVELNPHMTPERRSGFLDTLEKDSALRLFLKSVIALSWDLCRE